MKQLLMDCVLPFLPEEIITDILKQLPVKSLIRFRSVCKHWKNLIKTPAFVQDHLNNSTRRNPSLLIEHVDGNDSISFCLLDCEMQSLEVVKNPPFLNSLRCISIVGSSNGLLCITDPSTHPNNLLLWNPATREVRHLPSTFEDFCSITQFGFGFSPFINDYKIVRVCFDRRVCGIEVFSLSTGRWKNIEIDNIKDVYIGGHGVTVNGVMFWKGRRLGFDETVNGVMFWKGRRLGFDESYVIVSFDMASEVFTVIPWPISLHLPNLKFTLVAYEDKLAIISHPEITNNYDSSIYFAVMEEGVIGSSEKRWSLSRKYLYDFCPFNLSVGTVWRNHIVYIDSELARYITQLEGEKENDNDEAKFGL